MVKVSAHSPSAAAVQRSFLNANVCPFSIQPVLSYRQHRWPFSYRGSRKRCGPSTFCVLMARVRTVPAAGYISDSSNASFWNVDYYQHHFDVDTKTVSFFPHTLGDPE